MSKENVATTPPTDSVVKKGYGALKIVASVVTGLATILTVAFTIDSRYVHAQDLRTEGLRQQQQVIELQTSSLDDKIFELEIRKSTSPRTWTATDQLILDRYKGKYAQIRVQTLTVQAAQRANASQQADKK